MHPSASDRRRFARTGGALVVVLSAAAAAPAPAQVLAGRIVEAGSERPVATATVFLVADGRFVLQVESDDGGRFRLRVPRPGEYGLRVERIGYAAATTDTLTVGLRDTVEVTIRLGITAVELGPLMIVERRVIVTLTEFERRAAVGRLTGRGVFLTRPDIDSTGSASVSGVLSRVPLVAMRYGANGMATPITLSQGGCTPTLYQNGARLVFSAGESIDSRFLPDDIEGIEVYRNPVELPPNFTGIGHCGAINFWTRQSVSTRGRLWRFFAAAGAITGIAALFIAM